MNQKRTDTKKYHITTFGCQANVHDSEIMSGILEALDFFETKDETQADLLIVNTCSVRQKSEDKVFGMGRKVREIRELHNPDLKIIIAGCMVGSVTGERQRYEFKELVKKTSWANSYISPAQIRELPKILHDLNLIDEWAIKALNLDATSAKRTATFAPGENAIPSNTHAFVNISLGCDNFCTFCVVPYARGKEISRPKLDILKEITHLLQIGYTSITLCGQNVNSWGLATQEKFDIRTGSDQKLPFADLLREIHALPGLEKLSFISSNPFDFTSDLIDVLKLPKISRYLHIALQSGNDEILKKMNRRHSAQDFISLIAKIRESVPEIEIGTDIIVGFPGETSEQFDDTVKACREIGFSVAYISIYSPRKGTPAERFYPDDIPLPEKKRRHAYLTEIIETCKRK